MFTEESLSFQERISQRNGVSDHAYLPPALHASPAERAARVKGAKNDSRTMAEAREEARMVLFGTVDELLTRLGLRPADIDVLVVNCSLFNPTPSLSAMIVNHFKMRSDVLSYNLAGMGCSAGVIAVGLAQRLLRTAGRGKYALVVSTENITQNWQGRGWAEAAGRRWADAGALRHLPAPPPPAPAHHHPPPPPVHPCPGTWATTGPCSSPTPCSAWAAPRSC